MKFLKIKESLLIKILVGISILLSSPSSAMENISSTTQKEYKKFSISSVDKNNENIKIIKKFLLENLSLIKNLDSLNIFYMNNNNKSSTFLSNAEIQCEININYNKPIFLENTKKDIIFALTHEISHCILGQDGFSSPFQWSLELSEKQKLFFQHIIQIKENNNYFPLIIYHELFADNFATLYLLKNNILNKQDIEKIIQYRERTFLKNQHYFCFESLKNLLKLIDDKKIFLKEYTLKDIFDMSKLLAEKTFIKYLLNEEKNEF